MVTAPRAPRVPRATGHLSTHVATPQEKPPMFGQIHWSQSCCVTSLLIHPHQETVCPTLQRTARNWGSPGVFTARPRHQLSPGFYQVPMSNMGRVRSGRDEAFQGQRNGSSHPSPGPHTPSPLKWQRGDSPCPVCNNTVGQSLAFSTAWRVFISQRVKCSSPL